MVVNFLLEAIIVFLAGMLAASLASFAFVVGERPTRNESVVNVDSHCTSCGKPLRLIDNIPIFGWLINKGKSHCCGSPIPSEYFFGELMLFFFGAWSGYDILHTPTPYTPNSFWSAYIALAAVMVLAMFWRSETLKKQEANFEFYVPTKSEADEKMEELVFDSAEWNYMMAGVTSGKNKLKNKMTRKGK